jgi:hypothetical protein
LARVRRSRLAASLAIATLLACGNARVALPQDMTDARLFVPVPDGDPRNPSRFRKPAFGNPAGFGAGTTGFVSTNASRRKTAPPAAETPALPPLAPPDQTVQPVYREAPAGKRKPRAIVETPEPHAPPPRAQVIRRGPVDDDPFGPLGIRAGSFILKPSIDVTGGHDSNVTRAPNRQGSWLTTVTPELQFKSDWSRHELSGTLRGAYTWYEQLPNFNKPEVDAKVNARIDISSQTKADIEGRYKLLADSPGDPNTPGDTLKPPIYQTYGGTFGLTQKFNRLEVTGKGMIDRLQYFNAELDTGGTLDLSDRNYNQYGGAGRIGYEVHPGIKPFVEGGIDTRRYDDAAFTTPNRNSDGRTIKGGVAFELTRKLTGEAAFGYVERKYDDPTLQKISGLIYDGLLIWTATPLSTLRFDLKSTVDEVVLPGVSGALKRDVTVQLDHSFRRWLIGSLKFGFGQDDYIGLDRLDKRYLASAALTYKMTRTVHIKGEYRHEWLRSNVTGADYDADIVLLSLKLQR